MRGFWKHKMADEAFISSGLTQGEECCCAPLCFQKFNGSLQQYSSIGTVSCNTLYSSAIGKGKYKFKATSTVSGSLYEYAKPIPEESDYQTNSGSISKPPGEKPWESGPTCGYYSGLLVIPINTRFKGQYTYVSEGGTSAYPYEFEFNFGIPMLITCKGQDEIELFGNKCQIMPNLVRSTCAGQGKTVKGLSSTGKIKVTFLGQSLNFGSFKNTWEPNWSGYETYKGSFNLGINVTITAEEVED